MGFLMPLAYHVLHLDFFNALLILSMCSIDLSIKGAYTERSEADRGTGVKFDYYRLANDIHIDQDPMRLQHIISSVFANLAMKCIIAKDIQVGARMESWLATLRTFPNLHFDVSPQEPGASAKINLLDVESLKVGDPPICRPPVHVVDLLPESRYWLAFDIETHDLAPSQCGAVAWLEGQYGHPCRFHTSSLHELRIAQLGWCICKSFGSTIVEKKRFVSPTDFTITKRAEMKHGITNKQLRQLGDPLRVVLEEFLCDVVSRQCSKLGGRDLCTSDRI